MICVIDASAAVEIVLKRSNAVDLINKILTSEKVLSPALFYAETGNVFRKYIQGGYLDEEQAIDLYRKAIQLVDEFVDIRTLNEEALRESIRLSQPLYDLLYMVLARRNAAKLITCDKKMQVLYKSF
jgi:predicted nucleic acid-binding protein